MEDIKMLKEYLESKKYHNKVTSKKHLLNKFPYLSELENDLNFSGQLYCLLNNIEYPICKVCKKPYVFVSFKKGFLKYCNNKCDKNKIYMYKDYTYEKVNGNIKVCKKHNTIISEKIFTGLIDKKAECLCEHCSKTIIKRNVIDEEISKDTRNNFKELFLDRKNLTIDYIKKYFPYTYNKILSIKVTPNIFRYKLNQFVNEYDLV